MRGHDVGMTHFCWILTHLLSMMFGMKSSNEGLEVEASYEAVTNPALEDDLNENIREKETKQTCC